MSRIADVVEALLSRAYANERQWVKLMNAAFAT